MPYTKQMLAAILLVLTIQLVGCIQPISPETPAGNNAQPVATPAAAARTPITASEPMTMTGTPVVSHGGPVEDYISLIDNLRAAGATVEPVGPVDQPFLAANGQVIQVNGADVQVFEYANPAAAEADAAQIAPDGSSTRTTMITWVAPPHFYKQGRLIVLYVGSDEEVLSLLESVVGAQFAGQ